MSKPLWIASCVLLPLLAGCAAPPEQEMQAVSTAMEQLKSDGDAMEYAPEAVQAAQDAQAAFDAEIQAQSQKFPLTRSYDVALQKGQAATAAAQDAVAKAAAAKEQAQAEATESIASVRGELEQVRMLLAGAPRGKGTRADLAALTADLDGAGTALDEASALMTESRYREAAAKADAAGTVVLGVRTEIETAMAAVKR